MAQILVQKNREMKERSTKTKCINLRQATMTQEFEAVADRSANVEPLPPGWIRIWDNPGGRYYFFNTADHDIQHDLTRVHAKVALNALNDANEARATENQDQENEDPENAEDDVPDPVGSASRIIRPSPVKSEYALKNKRKTPPQTSYGGIVDMSLSSSDEEIRQKKERQFLRELLESDDSSTDCEDNRKPAPVYKGAFKKVKKRRLNKKKVSPVAKLPRVQSKCNLSDGSTDESVDSVGTQELPNTQDFVGAEALVNLQTEPIYFEGQEDREEDEEDDEEDDVVSN